MKRTVVTRTTVHHRIYHLLPPPVESALATTSRLQLPRNCGNQPQSTQRHRIGSYRSVIELSAYRLDFSHHLQRPIHSKRLFSEKMTHSAWILLGDSAYRYHSYFYMMDLIFLKM